MAHARSNSSPIRSTKRTLPPPMIEAARKRPRSLDLACSPTLACPRCQQHFSVPFALQRHIATVHSGGRNFRCSKCKRSFSRKDTFERHRASHSKAGFVSCPGCLKAMRPDYLRTHLLAWSNRRCSLAQVNHASSSPTAATSTSTPEDDSRETNVTSVVNTDTRAFRNDSEATLNLATATSDASALYFKVDTNLERSYEDFTAQTSDAAALASILAFSYSGDMASEKDFPTIITPVQSDPLLFEPEENDNRTLPYEMREELMEWNELLLRASIIPRDELSSVASQVRTYLCKTRSKPKQKGVLPGSLCEICENSIGETRAQMIAHGTAHLNNPPETRFNCSKCSLDFVFKRDFRSHCQRSANAPFANECDQLTATVAGIWINEVIRDQFVQDLRLWEKFQLFQYLDNIESSADCRLTRIRSADSLPDRWSESSLFSRWSIITSRSCTLNRRHDPSDIITVTERLKGANLNDENMCIWTNSLRKHRLSTVHCPGANSPLCKAVRNRRLDLILKVLRGGQQHICDTCKRYALCSGCLEGLPEVVLALLDAGVDPNTTGPESLPSRPLNLAMLHDRRDIVKLLLESGAKVLDRNAAYFIQMAKCGNTAIFLQMLASGLNPDSTVDKEPLLVVCARMGHANAIRPLLESGARPESMDSSGLNALHHASIHGRLEMVQYLLDAGAFIDAPILGLTDSRGRSPLMLACNHSHWQVVSTLLARGANVHALDLLQRNALHHACEAGKQPDSDVTVYRLLTAKAEVDLADVSGTTPLMYASMSGSRQLVRTLLFWGADAHARAHSGLDAVRMARKCNNLSVVDILES